jgi:ribose 5-phosphate isomerase B
MLQTRVEPCRVPRTAHDPVTPVGAGRTVRGTGYNPSNMRIAIGADHAGFVLKEHLVTALTLLGHEVDDMGTYSTDPVDYPGICAAVARAVADGRFDRGIVVGGSGQGEQIAANKIPGIRAALCNDLYTARLSREHNDANVLSLGARVVAAALAGEIVRIWMETPFEGGRHKRRIEQIAELEKRFTNESA